MKQCNKSSADPKDHRGPINYYNCEDQSAIGLCANCGNSVVLRLTPGEKAPPITPYQPVIDPPQKA